MIKLSNIKEFSHLIFQKIKTVTNTKKIKYFCLILLILTLLEEKSFQLFVDSSKINIACDVVRLLYDFGSKEQIESNSILLKSKVTEDVYNQVSYDNEARLLSAYVKFYDCSSSVIFIEKTSDYIIYSLDCDSIDKSRQFIFRYQVNRLGKIYKIDEAELLNY